METLVINKSIAIDAAAEKVWDVLFQDHFNRIWYAEFSPGTYAITDWQVGSKVVFLDISQSGIIGKIVESNPFKILSLEYTGILVSGVEDYDTEDAHALKGDREIYNLEEEDGKVKLNITGDMAEQYYEAMSASWEKALLKIKELAE